MSMLQRRLQILIDDGRYQRLQHHARDRGISVAAVIRDLVDTGLPNTLAVRQAAFDRLMAAEPMEVPDDPRDLRRELDDAHDRFET